MSRILTVAAAQLGPVQRSHTREEVVARMIGVAAPGRAARCRTRRVPGAGADHLLPALVRRRHHRGRPLLRALDAQRRDPAAVRRGRRLGIGFSIGYALLDDEGHRWNVQTLVERDGSIVASYTKIAHPRARARRTRPSVPTRRALLLRTVTRWLRRVASLRWLDGHDDLQRPPLAGDLPRHGLAGRRDDPVRLQHAHPLRAGSESGHPPGVPQRARDAGGRVSERHVGRRCRQGWSRRRRRLARAVDDHRPERADRCAGSSPPTTSWSWRVAISIGASGTRARCSTSTGIAGPSCTTGSLLNAAWSSRPDGCDHTRPGVRAPPPVLGSGPRHAGTAEAAGQLHRDPRTGVVAARRRARRRDDPVVGDARRHRGTAVRDHRDHRSPREPDGHRRQPVDHRRRVRRGRRAGQLRVRSHRPSRCAAGRAGLGRERAVPSRRWPRDGGSARRVHVQGRDLGGCGAVGHRPRCRCAHPRRRRCGGSRCRRPSRVAGCRRLAAGPLRASRSSAAVAPSPTTRDPT